MNEFFATLSDRKGLIPGSKKVREEDWAEDA